MNKNDIKLEKLTLKDLPELRKVGRKTYSDAFSSQNSKENMRSYLDAAFSNEKLACELNEEQSTFYFAKYEGETIGYLKVNFGSAQTDLKDSDAMELERIYIVENFQGRGIGKKLLANVIEIAQEKELNYLWLGVWKKNKKAIEFYEREGFIIFDSHSFVMGDEVQSDALMKLTL